MRGSLGRVLVPVIQAFMGGSWPFEYFGLTLSEPFARLVCSVGLGLLGLRLGTTFRQGLQLGHGFKTFAWVPRSGPSAFLYCYTGVYGWQLAL